MSSTSEQTSTKQLKKHPKVILVGPTHPYRGGIAQYNDALEMALRKVADVSVVTFKKLYPALLYPGKSDKVAKLSESERIGTQFILSATSPLSWYRAFRTIRQESPDVVIIAWWTFFWQPVLGYVAWRLKSSGIKVVFLCHNVVDHEANWVKQFISKSALRACGSYITHSADESAKLQAINPDALILRRPHPIYTHFPPPTTKSKKRAKLDLLYFGLIRPYKGVNILLEAMSKLDNSVHLTVVGEVWGSKNEQKLLNQIRKSGASIDYNFSYVDDQLAANYFANADAVILPYLSATGSGVVTLAYNYGKPVIASNVSGLADVVIDNQTGWLFSPVDAETLAQTIRNISRNDALSKKAHIRKYCEDNSWDNMASKILEKFVEG